ncbi:hypothetical protein GCM10010441_00400 [Kitasatospora paracochleata]|uniref:DNA-directed RNA polymerase specialized sigma24 family protein n=1 Tax=Kitasatospora paracochleata TaxID=58354 RepID=A0ABT1IWR8_9ACTN|nr:sigma-70 family RNA polymerase sigma factor [Kitasatospora paracochleata]MCP2309591.1 DNA-directed RNA polymerase specialized sigma24 family protein [Kitasatospora paracochleata]
MTTRLASPTSCAGDSPVLPAYGRAVDGLFTYCLSVLCEHDTAVAAVAEVRDLALRHGDRLADPGLLRAWLYALARHCCLTRLAGGVGPSAPVSAVRAAERRDELASLAWPEAAGTDPEQREVLELAVRHRLSVEEVAAVLGVPPESAATLLDAAGAEVGRTRTALLVLGVGSCPELARLGGVGAESWRGWVLGPALRRELVGHVVTCPTCRGTAERVADELGSGLAGLPGLPLLPAPLTVRIGGTAAQLPNGTAGAAFLAGAAAGRRAAPGFAGGLAADGSGAEAPRFDQQGFPRHRAPSNSRSAALRQRVVTTGVLAAVLTAPVVALWGAHREGGGASAAAPVSSVRVDGASNGTEQRPAEQAPDAGGVTPPAEALQLVGASAAETSLPPVQGPLVPVPSRGAARLTSPVLAAVPVGPARPSDPGQGVPGQGAPAVPAAPGQLTVEAGEYGNRTVITLTNTGGTAIAWHAVPDVDWLRLSRDSGTLAPGQRLTVTVTVDEARAPEGHWTARIALPPSEAVVTLEGGPVHRGGTGSPSDPAPGPSSPTTDPSTPAPPPTPPPSTPSPTPTPTPTHTPTSTPTSTPAPAHSSPPASGTGSGPAAGNAPAPQPAGQPS